MSHRKPLSMMQAQRLLFKINNPDIDYEPTRDDIEDLVKFMRTLVETMKPIFQMIGDALMETLEAVQREFSWFLDLTPDEQAAVIKDIKAAQGRAMFDAHSRAIGIDTGSPGLGKIHSQIFNTTTPEHMMGTEKLAQKMREQGW